MNYWIFRRLLRFYDYDWAFKSTPQVSTGQPALKQCMGSIELTVWQKHNTHRVHHVPRGKMLGGSSGINFLAHTRPSAKDLDSWATQAPRWSWDSLQPYFARHETLLPDPRSGERPKYFVRDTEIHGHSGPVIISWSPTPPSITSAVIDAVSEVSVPCEYKDLSAGRHQGFAHHLTTVDRRDGKIERSYAANAYLEPILDRPNLHILTKATAFQIV